MMVSSSDKRVCKKCKGMMERKGKITSGNSYFDIWKCQKCDSEEMICSGLVQR
jgi:DNA-directed RNA polymerase subunit M/transcription elongation factor TFIIS